MVVNNCGLNSIADGIVGLERLNRGLKDIGYEFKFHGGHCLLVDLHLFAILENAIPKIIVNSVVAVL